MLTQYGMKPTAQMPLGWYVCQDIHLVEIVAVVTPKQCQGFEFTEVTMNELGPVSELLTLSTSP